MPVYTAYLERKKQIVDNLGVLFTDQCLGKNLKGTEFENLVLKQFEISFNLYYKTFDSCISRFCYENESSTSAYDLLVISDFFQTFTHLLSYEINLLFELVTKEYKKNIHKYELIKNYERRITLQFHVLNTMYNLVLYSRNKDNN